MKKISILLVAIAMFTVSCLREPMSVIPALSTKKVPDSSFFKLKLHNVSDSTLTTETILAFIDSAHAKYVPGEDSPNGLSGKLGLVFVSSDGVFLGIDERPYFQGMNVKLVSQSKTTAPYLIDISQISPGISPSIKIWLKDSLLGDSVNLRKTSYSFTMNPGKFYDRFSVTIK